MCGRSKNYYAMLFTNEEKSYIWGNIYYTHVHPLPPVLC